MSSSLKNDSSIEDAFVPKYFYMYDFEKTFVHQKTRDWMTDNWITGFYYCALYLLIVFSLQRWMKNRSPYKLKKVLIVWNSGLAIFSIIGASRTLPEMLHVLKNFGIYHSCCIQSFIENDRVAGFWTWMFTLSKVPELGDTIFIVLRKRPLMFLHWYHHTTVLLYTWYAFKEYTSSARWYIVMNYCVHSIMYSYYALSAIGMSPPKFIAMFITTLQISQMVTGCLVNYWAYKFLTSGQSCHISMFNIKLATVMYFSYFLLFGRYFYKSYISKSFKRPSSSSDQLTTKDASTYKLMKKDR